MLLNFERKNKDIKTLIFLADGRQGIDFRKIYEGG